MRNSLFRKSLVFGAAVLLVLFAVAPFVSSGGLPSPDQYLDRADKIAVMNPIVFRVNVEPDDSQIVQEVIDHAHDCGRIEVQAGTYLENVVVDKIVETTNDGFRRTIIDCSEKEARLIKMTNLSKIAREQATRNLGDDQNPAAQNPDVDQNPAIVTDGRKNLLFQYEYERQSSDYDIGVGYSKDGGSTWLGKEHYFSIPGHPKQPRLDFVSSNSAYGTWLPDQNANLGCIHISEFLDITDPQSGGGWAVLGSDFSPQGIGIPFTSADVGCYDGPQKPKPHFWGLLGLTGDVKRSGEEEDDTFLCAWPLHESVLQVFWFTNYPYYVFNISVDIDQSNAKLIFAAEYIRKGDPSNYGTIVLTHQIIPSENWMQGYWYAVEFPQCFHPSVEAKNGRVYIATEYSEGGNKDIVCWSSTTPEDWSSWKGYFVTDTTTEKEMYPTISAESGTEATIVFTKNGNLYASKSMDGGITWSVPEQINDVDEAVVEQYGCADIDDKYVLWTDSRNGNNDIYFDSLDFGSPDKPTIDGTTSGDAGVPYTYTFTSTDPEGDDVSYYIKWGDGNITDWTDFQASGTSYSESHTWSAQGTYIIKAKAKDPYGAESEWGELEIEMPKNKAFNFNLNLLGWLFERFPNAFPILRYLLGL